MTPENELEARLQRLSSHVATEVAQGRFKPPMLPEIAVQLSELAAKPDVDLRDVETAVSRDPAVAGRILSVARSALYSRGAAVKSLRVAIMRIGLFEVRDIAFQLVARSSVFRVPGYSERLRELFEAAQASGLVARELCRLTNLESDLAYLCGLLHDIGEAIVLSIVAQCYQETHDPLPPVEDLADIIEKHHGLAGAKVCGMWNLPEPITDAALHHHRPEACEDSFGMVKLTACVDEALAHVGFVGAERIVDPYDNPIFRLAGLSDNQIEALLAFTEMLMETPEAWMLSYEENG